MKKSNAGNSTRSSTRPQDNNTLKYTGVRKRKWGKWVSEIRLPNSRDRIWLGSYDSPIKAARAFDAAQFCLRGKTANFNFPNNTPYITRTGRSMTPNEIQVVATRFANEPLDEPEEMQQSTVEISSGKDEEESMTSNSSSIFDGDYSSMAQIESDVAGVDQLFYDLNATLGSDDFGMDFNFFPGFDDFGPVNFYSPGPDALDFGFNGDDCYDTSIYQRSLLWNF